MLIIFTLAQVASLITLVFPVAARYSVNLALAARLILGWFCPVFFGLLGLFYCSSQFSVPKRKTICSQPAVLCQEIFNVRKLLLGWAVFFLLWSWKLGGLVINTLYRLNQPQNVKSRLPQGSSMLWPSPRWLELGGPGLPPWRRLSWWASTSQV